MKKKFSNNAVIIFSMILLAACTFFVFFKSSSLYIDLQALIINRFGNAFLVMFIAYTLILCVLQLLKLIKKKGKPLLGIVEKIPQTVFLLLFGINGIFTIYMFLDDLGFDALSSLYARLAVTLICGIALLFWFPKSPFKRSRIVKTIIIVAAVCIAASPAFCTLTGKNSMTFDPVVYIVGDEYQIVWHTDKASTAWVTVNGETYYDTVAGAIRAREKIHKVSIPVDMLDSARAYTIGYQCVFSRGAYQYGTYKGNVVTRNYAFRPADFSDGCQIYNISDHHSVIKPAASAGKYWGEKLDLLILNGDIINDITTEDKLLDVLELGAAITGGSIPVLYARGNHETRGAYTEYLDRYVGCPSGDEYYFTTRIANMWILTLDLAEDKLDNHVEYSGFADYMNYRHKQTAFIKDIVDNKAEEYAAEGIDIRLLICHIRVNSNSKAYPEIVNTWNELSKDMGFDLHLSGHSHRVEYMPPSEATENSLQIYYPTIIGSRAFSGHDDINDPSRYFTGTAVEIEQNGNITAWFTNQNHEIIKTQAINY